MDRAPRWRQVEAIRVRHRDGRVDTVLVTVKEVVPVPEIHKSFHKRKLTCQCDRAETVRLTRRCQV
jgi:hypothetical protein